MKSTPRFYPAPLWLKLSTFALSICLLLVTWFWLTLNKENTSKQKTVNTDLSVLQKMKPIAVKATKPVVQSDTGDLKNANWFASIQKEMSRGEYFIKEDASTGTFGSPNRRNNLRFTYDANGFSVKPRTTKIPLEELKPGQHPDSIKYKTINDWSIRFDLSGNHWGTGYWEIANNKAEYVTDKVTVQYHNQETGMRQNFVVKAPIEKEKKLTIRFNVSTTLKVKSNNSALDFSLNGEKVMQYKDLKVWDTNGKTLAASIQLKGGDSYLIEVDDKEAVYPITIDPISTTANTMVESNNGPTNGNNYDGAHVGYAVSGAGDVNGDGYDDVIVGAPNYTNGQSKEGAFFIYHGNATNTANTTNNTASAASSTPTLCINTALTNIIHTTTGATGIGTASGLPSGVTAAWANNTITISGSPTASGTFNYSIPLTGGSGSVNATGTITVLNCSSNCTFKTTPKLSNAGNFVSGNNLCVDKTQNLLVSTIYTGSNYGGYDFLLIKKDQCGNDLWSISGGSAGNDNIGSESGKGIVTDNDGNIYIVGGYGGNLTVNGTNNTIFTAPFYSTSNPNQTDGFIIKLDKDGKIIWGITLRGGSNDFFKGLTIDNAGNILCSGIINGCCPSSFTATMYGPKNDMTLSGIGFMTAIVVKVKSDGTLLWNARIGNRDVSAIGIISDINNNVYFTGIQGSWSNGTSGTLTDGVGSSSSVYNPGIGNGYLIKLDENGNKVFTVSMGNGDGSTDLGMDSDGNINLIGTYQGSTANFRDVNDNSIIQLPAQSNYGTFLVKYSNTGTPLLAKQINQSNGETNMYRLNLYNNNIYLVGHYTSTNFTGADKLYVQLDKDFNVIKTVAGTNGGNSYNDAIAILNDQVIVEFHDNTGSYLSIVDNLISATNTVGNASSTPTLCINTALTNITHTTTGATGIGTTTGLPTGVTAAWANNTITISGSPTASGTFNYSIPLTGGSGNVNATGTITVLNCASNCTFNTTPKLSDAGINFHGNNLYVDKTQNLLVSTLYTGSNYGGYDFLLIKKDQCGNDLWSISGGSTGNDYIGSESGKGIVTDNDGNIYLVGRYTGNLTVNGTNTTTFTAPFFASSNPNHTDGFIIKLDKDGKIVWGITLRGESNDGFNGVTIDNEGNILCSSGLNGCCPSSFTATIYGPKNDMTVSGIGYGTGMVVKVKSDGTLLWNARIGNRDVSTVGIICDVNNNVYFTGMQRSWSNGTNGTLTDGTGANSTVYNPGIGNGYLIKLDKNGNRIFSVALGNNGSGPGSDTWPVDLGIDSDGNINLIGTYQGSTAYFRDVNDNSIIQLPAQSNYGTFLVKYSNTGTPLLAKQINQSNGETNMYRLNVYNNNTYLIGHYTSTNFTGADKLYVQLDKDFNVIKTVAGTNGGNSYNDAIAILNDQVIVEFHDNTGSYLSIVDNLISATNTVGNATSTPTLCINTILTNITHTTTGATGIGTATGLPAGVTAAWANNTITISGTPTAPGTFNYSIPLTGGTGSVNATGTITVTAANTVSAPSSTPTLYINTALTPITHTTTGATGIGTASGLPAGITAAWANNIITISGTPTATGSFNYSIPLTGGCGSVNATMSIQINPTNTATGASSTPTLPINNALTSITHTTTGATGIGTPTGLPPGVTASWTNNTITISGTPTASGTFTYSIPLIGGGGTVYATGTITVIAANTVSAASYSPSLCKDFPLTNVTHTTTGANGIGTATGLPAGVTATWVNNTITISGTPTVAGVFNYNIPLTGGSGTSNATGTITTISCSAGTNTWTGTNSNLWNNPGNWSLGTIPASNETFTITTGTPQLNIDFTIGGNMTISGTGNLTVNPGKTLSVAAGGTADFGYKSVTFKSDATGTAQLGQVLGTLSNASNVTMERYIPARRAYRFIAAPVTTTTTIKQNWMESATLGTTASYPFAAGSAVNPTAGYGTHITGASGNTNGFDATVNNNASMFTFNNGWITSTNTNATLAAGDAYRLFVRGDRGTDLNNNGAAPSATVLRTTGTPHTGNKVIGLSTFAGAWNFVGNPFQSTVDGDLVAASNITPYYYAWDPKVGTRGAYVTYDFSAGINSFTGSQINKYFQPGQAFFVQTDMAGTANLTFTESAKAIAANQTAVFQAAVAYPMLNATLHYTDSLAKNAPAMDGFKLLFDNSFSNSVDRNDAQKLTNQDENISINQGGTLLSIEKRQLYNAATEVQISTSNYVRQQYTVQLSWSNPIDNGFQAQLVDNYTNTTTPIAFSGNTNYAYTVDNTIAASKSTDRFKIVFVPNAALPVSGIELGGTATDKQVKLSFKALNEREMSNYAIERSADGTSFAKIGTQQPLNGTQASASYSFVDNQPIVGNNYYRIKGSSSNGQIQFSNVAVVKYGVNLASVTVVPNPIQGKTVNLRLSQLAKGNYYINITDAIGRTILKKEMLLDGSSSVQLNLPTSVKAGNYFVKVDGLGNTFIQTFIIQ